MFLMVFICTFLSWLLLISSRALVALFNHSLAFSDLPDDWTQVVVIFLQKCRANQLAYQSHLYFVQTNGEGD